MIKSTRTPLALSLFAVTPVMAQDEAKKDEAAA